MMFFTVLIYNVSIDNNCLVVFFQELFQDLIIWLLVTEGPYARGCCKKQNFQWSRSLNQCEVVASE
jgi:hypothetical protein